MTTGQRTADELPNPVMKGKRAIPRLPNPKTTGWGASPSYVFRIDAGFNDIPVTGGVGVLDDPAGGQGMVVGGTPAALTKTGRVLYLPDNAGTYNTTTWASLAAPWSLVVVARAAANCNAFGGGADANNHMGLIGYGGQWLARTVIGGTVRTITSPVATTPAAFQILVMVCNGANSVLAVNGQDATGDLASPALAGPLYIGKKYAADGYLRPQFATAGIYSGALSQGQRAQVYTALKQRYGL